MAPRPGGERPVAGASADSTDTAQNTWRRLVPRPAHRPGQLAGHLQRADRPALRGGAGLLAGAADLIGEEQGLQPQHAAAIAEVQALLGDHQDTVVAEAWLRDAGAGFVAAGELIAAEGPERGNLRSDGRRSGNGHRPRSYAAGSDQLAAGSPGWLPGPGPAADAA
jgi:hypothetical protein